MGKSQNLKVNFGASRVMFMLELRIELLYPLEACLMNFTQECLLCAKTSVNTNTPKTHVYENLLYHNGAKWHISSKLKLKPLCNKCSRGVVNEHQQVVLVSPSRVRCSVFI
jgi:hypothetical protein